MSEQLTRDDISKLQKTIATMPNYAMWALLKAASMVYDKNKSDDEAVSYMYRAVQNYEENKEMAALDTKLNSAFAKHLKGQEINLVGSFIDMREDFLKQLKEGNSSLESAKTFLRALDQAYVIRHRLVEKEPSLAQDYDKVYYFAHDLFHMIKKY